MNRRSFAAALAALPFVGTAKAATAKSDVRTQLSEATETRFVAGQRDFEWVMTPQTWRDATHWYPSPHSRPTNNGVIIETEWGPIHFIRDARMEPDQILISPRGLWTPEAATVPDIHLLQPGRLDLEEHVGVIKVALVDFADADHASLLGKTYGFFGTPLICTSESRTGWLLRDDTDATSYTAYFEEINL